MAAHGRRSVFYDARAFGGAGEAVQKLAALYSGGKDSTHSIYLALQRGFEVSTLVVARPKRSDSHMFHTPNLDVTRLAAQAMGLPIHELPVSGEPELEVEELEAGLRRLVDAGRIDGLLAGAIASDYQWARLNEIGHRLGLPCLTPLWRVDPERVLRDELASGLKFMIVAAQSEGLNAKWLGHTFDEPFLERLVAQAREFRFNVAGEGGEYETLVTDGPLFSRRIRVEAYHVVEGESSSYFVVDEAVLADHGGPV
jgi:diphthine-ammonia ligase